MTVRDKAAEIAIVLANTRPGTRTAFAVASLEIADAVMRIISEHQDVERIDMQRHMATLFGDRTIKVLIPSDEVPGIEFTEAFYETVALDANQLDRLKSRVR